MYCKIEKQLLWSGEKMPKRSFPPTPHLILGSIYDEINRITLLFLHFKSVVSSDDKWKELNRAVWTEFGFSTLLIPSHFKNGFCISVFLLLFGIMDFPCRPRVIFVQDSSFNLPALFLTLLSCLLLVPECLRLQLNWKEAKGKRRVLPLHCRVCPVWNLCNIRKSLGLLSAREDYLPWY